MKAHQASATARLIAGATVLCAGDSPRSGLVAPGAAAWCEEFLGASRMGRRMRSSCRWAAGRRAWAMLERAAQPGIVRHWMMRKRWIEARVRAAIGIGASQLVVLGAGFDTLGARLAAESPTLRVVELDHPATLAVKRPVIQRLLGPDRIVMVGADFQAEGRDRMLPPDAIDRDLATIFVAEGLLMYLPEREVVTLFGELSTATDGAARLVFSFMVARPDGRIGFEPRGALVSSWLAANDERFRWSLDPERCEEFAGRLGWDVIARADSVVLSRLGDGAGAIARGEVVVEAIKSDSG